MARLKRPLDAGAVARADDAFYAEHPEMVHDGERIPLSPDDPKQAALRREWAVSYQQQGGAVEAAAQGRPKRLPGDVVHRCPEKNWIELKYQYCDGMAVGGASYSVEDMDSGAVVTGLLDDNGYAYQELPLSYVNVSYSFYNDPSTIQYRREPIPNPGAENVEEGWLERMKVKAIGAGEWVWGTVQGDFNEDPSIGQVATNAVITMIPVVDQVGDVRDVVANLKFLIWDKRYDDKWVWLALLLTLMGLIPVVGSAVKGVLKVIVKGMKTGAAIPIKKLVEVLNTFHKGNAIKWLRQLVEDLPTYGAKCKVLLINILADLRARLLVLLVSLPVSLTGRIKNVIDNIDQVSKMADNKLDELIYEIRQRLTKSIDEEADYAKTGVTKTSDVNKRVQDVSEPPAVDSIADDAVKKADSARLERIEELAKDPAQGGKATAKTRREAEVGLALEEQGKLKKPITRDSTGAAEFVDGNGQKWDVKGFNSEYAPKGYNTPEALSKIKGEIAANENVIVDTAKMSAEHVAELKVALAEQGLLDRILFF